MDLTDIDTWNASALDALVAGLTRRFTTIAEANRMLTTIGATTGWRGKGATAAKETFTSVSSSMNDEAAAIGAAAELARQTSAAVKELQAALAVLRADATGARMVVEPPPTVRDVAPDNDHSEDHAKREATRQLFLLRAKALVSQAEDIDEDTAAVLKKINNGEISYPSFGSLDDAFNAGRGGGRLTAPFWPEMDKKSPEEVNAWWRALPIEQKRQMVDEHPDIIGNLNGVDSESRDSANRTLLSAEIDRVTAEVRDLEDKYRNAPGYYAMPQVSDAKRQLADLVKLQRTIKADYSVDYGGDTRAYLLTFQPDGDKTKAAVAVGNPDHARRVSVTVPGVNTKLGSIESMVTEAGALRRETARIDHSGDGIADEVSSIAWIGYDTPDVGLAEPVWQAITDTKAKEGAHDLADFTSALGLTSDYSAHEQELMLTGHSYGSTTASLALQTGAAPYVDDAVFYGSPGLYANDTAAFGLERGHAYLMNDPDDVWINRAANEGFHGPNPFNSDFVQLATDERTTDDDIHRKGVDEHSEYSRAQETTGTPGTQENPLRISGYNLAAILAGGLTLRMKRSSGWAALAVAVTLLLSGCAWMEAPVPPPRTAPNPGTAEEAQVRLDQTVDEIAIMIASIVPGLVWDGFGPGGAQNCGVLETDYWYFPMTMIRGSNIAIGDQYWDEVSLRVKEIAARRLDAHKVREARYMKVGHILSVSGPNAAVHLRTEVAAVLDAEGGCHQGLPYPDTLPTESLPPPPPPVRLSPLPSPTLPSPPR